MENKKNHNSLDWVWLAVLLFTGAFISLFFFKNAAAVETKIIVGIACLAVHDVIKAIRSKP